VQLHPERLDQPLRWRRPRRVFVCSMADLFHELVPFEFIDLVFGVIERCPQHTFQVLTKRPERMRDYFASRTRSPLDNSALKSCDPILYQDVPQLWLGVSIENTRFTWRADVLREIPAAVRFISAEPLLGSLVQRPIGTTAVYSQRANLNLDGIDWLIVGGESGGKSARPMHPEWVRELRDACLERDEDFDSGGAGTAFFFKQWGSWAPSSPKRPATKGARTQFVHPVSGRNDVIYRGSAPMVYAGASPKSGGRLLDGREWSEMPAVREALPA
jgi:protein gp37